MSERDDEAGAGSVLFVYGAPFVGVVLVAVGIGAAVPGAYAIIQADLTPCGSPTIAVEGPAETAAHFGDDPEVALPTLAFSTLSPAERRAVREALDDPVGEAHVEGAFPNREAFTNGTFVTREGDRLYAVVVSENPCFEAAPLQFPLGVFAIALGVVGILTPPAYRRLIALEEGLE